MYDCVVFCIILLASLVLLICLRGFYPRCSFEIGGDTVSSFMNIYDIEF